MAVKGQTSNIQRSIVAGIHQVDSGMNQEVDPVRTPNFP